MIVWNGENGQDGAPATPTPYVVTEFIDPCGDHPGHLDELVLRLADGSLMAHYASGSLQFITLITPGDYVTTDKQKCHFTVTLAREVVW